MRHPARGALDSGFPIGGVHQVRLQTYKIVPSRKQTETMLAHLPKWVTTDRFVIRAKAEGKPTKDQMRLMMQSLLADLFKLAVAFRNAGGSCATLGRKRQERSGREFTGL
jgi:hypothetical protein